MRPKDSDNYKKQTFLSVFTWSVRSKSLSETEPVNVLEDDNVPADHLISLDDDVSGVAAVVELFSLSNGKPPGGFDGCKRIVENGCNNFFHILGKRLG